MIERFHLFLPSILALVCIATVTTFYLRFAIKQFGDNLKSVEWNQKNEIKVSLLVGTPLICILAPAVEELIFRAPLVVVFRHLDATAWCMIVVSSLIFGLIHWFGNHLWMPDILIARKNGRHQSDNVAAETTRLLAEMKGEIRIRKYAQVVGATGFGVLVGYIGVEYQSIWACFGIHSLWNFLVPAITFLIQLLIIVIWLLPGALISVFRWRFGSFEDRFLPIVAERANESGRLVKINLIPSKKWLRWRRGQLKR